MGGGDSGEMVDHDGSGVAGWGVARRVDVMHSGATPGVHRGPSVP